MRLKEVFNPYFSLETQNTDFGLFLLFNFAERVYSA